MEIILGMITIIVICKILGVSNSTLALGGVGLIGLLIIAMALFFIYFTVHLLLARTKKAAFSRIDVPEKGRFKVAYYIVDGVEYPCIFPKESAFNSRLYRSGRLYTVRFSRYLKKVYDKWAMITCIVGLFFSCGAVVLSLSLISELISFRGLFA
ncbi:MAG: hypothetical protein J6K77_02790 [Ruminococcus sp.]|nr:hypothetical protein [Ruminococcus sp.]